MGKISLSLYNGEILSYVSRMLNEYPEMTFGQVLEELDLTRQVELLTEPVHKTFERVRDRYDTFVCLNQGKSTQQSAPEE